MGLAAPPRGFEILHQTPPHPTQTANPGYVREKAPLE